MKTSKVSRALRIALFVLFVGAVLWSVGVFSSADGVQRSPIAALQLRAMRDLLLPDAPRRPPDRYDRARGALENAAPAPIERVTTEALEKTGAGEYHAWGYDGSGVKVAVIDEGFNGLADLIAQGEMPPDVVTRRFTGEGVVTGTLSAAGSAHGTACAEIVHDLAPGAQLYLIEVEDLIGNFEAILDYLAGEGVQIFTISMAVAPRHRGDGEGLLGNPPLPVYALLAEARERGMLVIKSAGNDAQRHYSGRFSDPDGDGWHAFGPALDGEPDETLSLQVEAETQVALYLRWDAWGSEQNAGYAMRLFDADGREVAQSTPDSADVERPVAVLTFTPPAAAVYHLRIRRADDVPAAHDLSLSAHRGVIAFTEHQAPAFSISPPADAATVLAVGAARVYDDALAPYSAQGPTIDGRLKPDLVSYSHVAVASADYADGFSGTSAAAPHAAGLAALLLNHANGSLTPDALEARLLQAAADKGPVGKDNRWGAGLAQLPPLNPHVRIPDTAREGCAVGPGRLCLPVAVHRSDGSAIEGLNRSAFTVALDAERADVLTVRALDVGYLLEVRPRLPLDAGDHTITVEALGKSARAVISLPALSPDRSARYFDVLSVPASPVPVGTPLRLQASLTARAPITDAWVRGIVQHPDGTERTLTLFDDGVHHDGLADDGVYGGTYAGLIRPGDYRLRLLATAETFDATTELIVDAQETEAPEFQGIPETWAAAVGLSVWGSDAYLDPDRDGVSNREEYEAGTDPYSRDTDGDGLSDLRELRGYYVTNPANPDTDLGGLNDAEELRRRTNPLDPGDDTRPPNRIYLLLRLSTE